MGWQLTAAQFMTLWEATDLDRMPYPLTYRDTADTEDVHRHHTRALLAWRNSLNDRQLADCVTALRDPTISVTVYAPYPEGAVRRRGCLGNDLAVLAEQAVGSVGGGDIHVSMNQDSIARNCTALALGLVGDLPACQAGHGPELSAHPDDLSPRNGTSILQSTIDSPGERIRRLLSQPRNGVGYICIRGRRDGLKEPLVDEFTWIDLDDGRYVHHVDDAARLFPASPSRLLEELSRRIMFAI
ncbi:ESX secretion-associated protein EspG [Rhodococcus sp. NPDC058521]|uniref:ESX secretion-associated protein EspG n=1 Tax=Rhodococcus sp. NPDC058521 TaxID=3346536 RepID=UPI003649A687